MKQSKKAEQNQLIGAILGLALLLGVMGLSVPIQAMPVIALPLNDITEMTYVGAEFFKETVAADFTVQVGESFEGVVNITSIRNADGTIDLSSQLADKEISAHFSFTATNVSPNHIEFGLGAADHFTLYVDGKKNYDDTLLRDAAIATVTDGDLWYEVAPGMFFESTNDPIPNVDPPFNTLNRAWMDIVTNNTGFDLTHARFPSSLFGRDPSHQWMGSRHGDHPAQMYFENITLGISSTFPDPDGFTFNIAGSVFVHAQVPEPLTASMGLLSLVALGLGTYRRR